ncbi:MAG: TIGR04283 family arsenosugar biosynthesis glycosyltransferase [Caldimicrobium sp.]|nr:TIGR04283 family arsenosugar biosynthesis glycosyltransferase [Caldimicrobium sp.]MDW8183550.1 TIGR04283 family arsenosugar biosynthesis glycosyltransferase [Caldimicrobium sp.]
MRLTLSVIIPTYNEEKRLGRLLKSLAYVDPDEVKVVDGGSNDETCKIAIKQGARVINAEKGRGSQLKKGALASCGELLLFLHADTYFTEKIDLRGLYLSGIRAGFFELVFDVKRGLSLSILERLINLRARIFSLPYGDQGLFIERKLYFEADEFSAIPFLEDLDFVLRLRKLCPPKNFPHKIVVSSRKHLSKIPLFPFIVSLRNNLLIFLYLLGVSPNLLSKIYK